MAKRPTRLRFTEDDLSSDAVKKAAGKAEKAAAKAEKAVDKITPKKHRKLRQEADVSASRTAKLRFGKAKADDIPPKPSGIKRTVTHAPVDTLSANVHKSISRYEDDNVGVQTAHQTELGAETAYHIADHAVYSHKLKAYDKAEKLVSKSDKANVNALFEKFKKDNPNASSNPLSRWRQKHNIKKEYAAARAGKGGKATAKGAGKTAKGVKSLTQKIADFCVSHKTALLWVLAIGLLFMVISGMFSACSTMFQGGTQVVLGTSFTAEDEDILGTDEDYEVDLMKLMDEEELEQLKPVEETKPTPEPETKPETDTEVQEPEPEPEKKPNVLPAILTILLLAGGGGFYAFKKLKGKKEEKAQEKPDPDADYVDDDEDYGYDEEDDGDIISDSEDKELV